MSFRFALAPLLRLRRSLERQRTLVLQGANLQVERAQQTLNDLDRYLAESDALDADALRGGRTAADLQFAGILRDNLRHFRRELETDLGRLEAARKKALTEYHQAYREREAMETLRARELREYQRLQERRSQQAADEAFLMQRWRR